jgi:hypothetical protein
VSCPMTKGAQGIWEEAGMESGTGRHERVA